MLTTLFQLNKFQKYIIIVMAVVEAADFAREQELISIQYVNIQIQDICLNCINTLQGHETEEVSRTWYSFLTGE